MFVLTNETLCINNKPGEATMSNLNIEVQPKLSKYWKNLKRCADFPTERATSEAAVRTKNEGLQFKCVLVLVYKNRAIRISEDGNIQEEVRNISFSQATPQEPKATVPIASGGALDNLVIN